MVLAYVGIHNPKIGEYVGRNETRNRVFMLVLRNWEAKSQENTEGTGTVSLYMYQVTKK